MNNKIYLLFLSVFIISTSCRKALETQTIETDSKKLAQCKTISCPEIDIVYLSVSDTDDGAGRINDEIEEFVIQSLFIGEEESGSTANSIEEAMEDFIKMYRTHSAEFPDLAAEYFAEITLTQEYNSKHLLSVRCQNYLYTGGAHGYGATTFKNFDPKTGKLLGYEDVFEQVAKLDALVEANFRKTHEIPQNQNINATGFWFENDTFYLPETFGISKEFVTLQYNQYEIASYAAGPIVVEIPISEVKELLKIPVD